VQEQDFGDISAARTSRRCQGERVYDNADFTWFSAVCLIRLLDTVHCHRGPVKHKPAPCLVSDLIMSLVCSQGRDSSETAYFTHVYDAASTSSPLPSRPSLWTSPYLVRCLIDIFATLSCQVSLSVDQRTAVPCSPAMPKREGDLSVHSHALSFYDLESKIYASDVQIRQSSDGNLQHELLTLVTSTTSTVYRSQRRRTSVMSSPSL